MPTHVVWVGHSCPTLCHSFRGAASEPALSEVKASRHALNTSSWAAESKDLLFPQYCRVIHSSSFT